MANRFDISDKLIHFTAGNDEGAGLVRLGRIIRERRLLGGRAMIRGGYRCVCFTEAPLTAFAGEFVRSFPFSRYSQFGLMFDKNWLYERGGRPVIYQPDDDFCRLPEELRWRHVRFEPAGERPVDFTWEREWRVQCDELLFTPADAVLVLPNEQSAEALRRAHDFDEEIQVDLYSHIMGRNIAELWRSEFPWRVVILT